MNAQAVAVTKYERAPTFRVCGISALQTRARRRAPGVARRRLFSDMMIPGGMSGLELAGEFRRRRPAVPIVLTTGLASWAVDARAADITLLLKPYGSDELGATLRAELKRAQA